MSLIKYLPSIDEVFEMEPEELGVLLLRYLATFPEGGLNRFNITSANERELYELFGSKHKDFAKLLMEAWMWLEREGFVLPLPGQQNDWSFITRKGNKIIQEENFDAYNKNSIFPKWLDPVIVRKVKPLFIRGDYDTAVFQAFKEGEVRVRKKAKLGNECLGRELMVKAFGPTGPLLDKEATVSEQNATRELFAGAISVYKNPSSHREVDFADPNEVIELICLANNLLRAVEKIQTED